MLGLRSGQGTIELSLAGIWDGRGVPETDTTDTTSYTYRLTSFGTVGNGWEGVQ